MAEVTIDGQFYGTYSLEEEQTVEIIVDDKVKNVLKIQNGKADMIAADCPDLLCVHQRAVSNQNETKNSAFRDVFGSGFNLQLCGISNSILFWHSGRKTWAYEYCCSFDAVLYGSKGSVLYFCS